MGFKLGILGLKIKIERQKILSKSVSGLCALSSGLSALI